MPGSELPAAEIAEHGTPRARSSARSAILRAMDPIAYPVRTPPAYWFVVVALFGLGAVAGYYTLLALSHGIGSWTILGVGGLMTALPAAYLLTTPEYRAQGAIRVGHDFVDVPDGRGAPIRFHAPALALTITRVSVRLTFTVVPVADFSRGMVLDLREGALRRRISTLTLVDPAQAAALVEDLERVRRGEPPLGPNPPNPPRRPDPTRDELEARLDRELAAMD